jgi:hypothetical protein
MLVDVPTVAPRKMPEDARQSGIFRHSHHRHSGRHVSGEPQSSGVYRKTLDSRSPITSFEDKFRGNDEIGF